MNCAQCNKPFTCGCQKHIASNGQTIHKTCAGNHSASQTKNLNLAQQQIKDLRNR
jgi:hypothetical protein